MVQRPSVRCAWRLSSSQTFLPSLVMAQDFLRLRIDAAVDQPVVNFLEFLYRGFENLRGRGGEQAAARLRLHACRRPR